MKKSKKKSNRKTVSILISLLALLGVGWLVSTVGGVGVRRIALQDRDLAIQGPLVPGLPFAVNWDVVEEDEDRSVLLVMHTSENTLELDATRFVSGELKPGLPCEVPAGTNTLQLTELVSQRVLIEKTVEVLAAGPDCLR